MPRSAEEVRTEVLCRLRAFYRTHETDNSSGRPFSAIQIVRDMLRDPRLRHQVLYLEALLKEFNFREEPDVLAALNDWLAIKAKESALKTGADHDRLEDALLFDPCRFNHASDRSDERD